MVAPCCGPGVPGSARKSGSPSSARFILSEVPSTRISLHRAAKLRIQFLRVQQFQKRQLRVEIRCHDARVNLLAIFQHDARTRGRRAPARGSPAHSSAISAPWLRAEAAIASETAPMPPCTNPHEPALAAHAAHAVMHQNVSGAGRTRAAIGADHAIGRQRDFDLRRFEPFIQKIRRALREDLHQTR